MTKSLTPSVHLIAVKFTGMAEQKPQRPRGRGAMQAPLLDLITRDLCQDAMAAAALPLRAIGLAKTPQRLRRLSALDGFEALPLIPPALRAYSSAKGEY